MQYLKFKIPVACSDDGWLRFGILGSFGYLISDKIIWFSNELGDAGFWNLFLPDFFFFFWWCNKNFKNIWEYICGVLLKKWKWSGTLRLGEELFKTCERLRNFEWECANRSGMEKITGLTSALVRCWCGHEHSAWLHVSLWLYLQD